MCGIFGELTLVANSASRAAFAASARKHLARRGPDGAATWEDAHCILGHTRLAIIDLSSAGTQPMVAASGNSVIAFNGEIYNYIELKQSLAPPVGGWRSQSDTEVLLEALDGEGPDVITSAVGMFAIAVWRPAERELLLIRDRLGKKPIYYARTVDGCFRFASEMGALLDDRRVRRTTTVDRIAEYLQHGYVSAPRTGLVDVQVVPPGSYLRARLVDGTIQTTVRRYWQLPTPKRQRAHSDWLEEFDATLRDAVRIRLRADVPLGAFLSGGIDSSVVSLLASEQLREPLRTFTVDFAEAGFSEGEFAAEVARDIGARHTRIALGADALGNLAELIGTYGDLHGDSSALPTMALCRATRQHVVVALSGDGGDELAGGYTRYHAALRTADAAGRLPAGALSAFRWAARHVAPPWMRGVTRIARLSRDVDDVYSLGLRFYSTTAWPPVLRQRGPTEWPDAVRDALATEAARPPLLRLMACDLNTYLPEDILVKVDRAAGAVGLEVRSPLLDHRLFELSMNADPSWLVDSRGGKAPLRTLYAHRLPQRVFARRKMGFGVPMGSWLRGVDEAASARLGRPAVCFDDLIDRRKVTRMLTVHRRGLGDQSSQLWQLLVLHAWCECWQPSVS